MRPVGIASGSGPPLPQSTGLDVFTILRLEDWRCKSWQQGLLREITAVSGTVVRTFLQLLPKPIEKLLPGGTMKFALQFFQSDCNYVVMMRSRKPWIRCHLQPQVVQQVEVLLPQTRRVGTQCILSRHPAR